MSLPAIANSSALGEVMLGGDFTGVADAPQLKLSGVISGNYKITTNLSVDVKGRTTSAGALTTSEINALVDSAYASTPSAFTMVNGRPMPNSLIAGASPGIIKLGTNVGTTGVIPFNLATTTAPGMFSPGAGLTMSPAGTLAFDSSSTVPSTGGTVNGVWANAIGSIGGATKTTFIVTAASEAVGKASVSFANTNEATIDLTSVLVTAATGTGAGASSGSLLVQVYLDASGNWYSATSIDAVSWTTQKITAPPGATPRITGMTYGNSTFIMIGQQATSGTFTPWSATSTDGVTWTYNSTPWASGIPITSGLIYAFSKFIATGRITASGFFNAISSSDGVTWASTSVSNVVGGAMSGITYSANTTNGTPFVATIASGVSSTYTFWISTNGTSWTAPTSLFGGNSLEPCITADNTGVYVHRTFSSIENIGRVSLSASSVASVLYSGGNSLAPTTASVITSMLPDNGGYVYIVQGGSYFRYEVGGNFTRVSGSSGSSVYPVSLGSEYVKLQYGDNNIGKAVQGSTVLTYNFLTAGSLAFTPQQSIGREVYITLPDNSSGGTPPQHDAVIGTITRVVIKGSTSSLYPNFEINFKSNATAVSKVANGNARTFTNTGTFKTYTAIYTSATEWLVFEE